MGCLEVAAEMGIMPSEFWGMTYGELVAFSRGHQRAHLNVARVGAHLAASIMNKIPSFSKSRRAVTADDLIGRRTNRTRGVQPPDSMRAKDHR